MSEVRDQIGRFATHARTAPPSDQALMWGPPAVIRPPSGQTVVRDPLNPVHDQLEAAFEEWRNADIDDTDEDATRDFQRLLNNSGYKPVGFLNPDVPLDFSRLRTI